MTPRERYLARGYLSPLFAFAPGEARRYRDALEAGERTHGLAPDRRRKMHLYLAWVDEIVRNPNVLDSVEPLIGPDILVYTVTLWLKEPRTDAFISWHQDSTYFGLEPATEHVTAWVALTVSNHASGCVQVVPGSHHGGQVSHALAEMHANMLPGQHIRVADDAPLDSLVLAPGEFSLHHTHLHHYSSANRSDDRRIGLGISYIPARCRCVARERLSAMLVRGTDAFGHFDPEPRPARDHDRAALAFHAEAVRRWHAARAELIPMAHQ